MMLDNICTGFNITAMIFGFITIMLLLGGLGGSHFSYDSMSTFNIIFIVFAGIALLGTAVSQTSKCKKIINKDF